jgi:hypothetical protein
MMVASLGAALGLSSCGIEVADFAQEGQNPMGEDGMNGGFDGEAQEDGSEISLYNDENHTYAQGNEERSAEEIATVDAILALHDVLRLKVAACAGISEDVAAFQAKRDELRDQGVDPKDIRDQLKASHQALKALMDESKEAIEQCKESFKDSEEVTALHGILEGCFVKPELGKRGGKGRKGKQKGPKMGGPRGPKGDQPRMGGKQGPKGPRHGDLLPPRKDGQFQEQTCVDAVGLAQILLGDASEAEEVVVDSDEETDEEATEEEVTEDDEEEEEAIEE